MNYIIRRATHEDKPEWLRMRQGLWSDAPVEYLSFDMDGQLGNSNRAVFVAMREDGSLVGFLEASLRDYAESAESSPVGYVEAWYVDEHARGQKIGKALLHTAEDWAREKGCREMGSDTWLENQVSVDVHKRLGYEEVERLVHFLKRL